MLKPAAPLSHSGPCSHRKAETPRQPLARRPRTERKGVGRAGGEKWEPPKAAETKLLAGASAMEEVCLSAESNDNSLIMTPKR